MASTTVQLDELDDGREHELDDLIPLTGAASEDELGDYTGNNDDLTDPTETTGEGSA